MGVIAFVDRVIVWMVTVSMMSLLFVVVVVVVEIFFVCPDAFASCPSSAQRPRDLPPPPMPIAAAAAAAVVVVVVVVLAVVVAVVFVGVRVMVAAGLAMGALPMPFFFYAVNFALATRVFWSVWSLSLFFFDVLDVAVAVVFCVRCCPDVVAGGDVVLVVAATGAVA